MSHFACVVLAASLNDVEGLLAPFDENGEWFADGSRWDSWTVGGRYSGLLDGYDPTADPKKGRRVKYAFGWRPHKGDVMALSKLAPVSAWRRVPLAVVTADGVWHENERMGWFGDPVLDERGVNEPKPAFVWAELVQRFVDEAKAALPKGVAVLVDCHV